MRSGMCFILGVICGTLVLLTGGCASTPDAIVSPVGASRSPGSDAMNGGGAARELAAAQRMLRAGEYSLVIPRLMQIASKYPESEAGAEARYFLGMAYYHIGGLREAVDNFEKYLELAPYGKYAEFSRDYVASLSDEVDRTTITPEELAHRIEQVEIAAAQQPLDFAGRLELADLYWRRGEYYRAGEMYEQLLTEWPQLASDTTIRTRIERLPTGEFVVLTPEEVSRRYAESEPLAIFNTSGFKSGRFEGIPATSRDRYYNVTGQVVNRGSDVLTNVQIYVTVYGFGSMVYGAQTVNIGRLRPGERRAFTARFGNFDNIDNVSRYECVGTYERQG